MLGNFDFTQWVDLKENKKLAQDILTTGGAIVRQLPMGTLPAAEDLAAAQPHFKPIEQLSAGGRGGENSGTGVIGRCGTEQNRVCFYRSGKRNRNLWTPNTLIKQGAKPVTRWDDVWEAPPSQVHLALDSEAGIESNPEIPASLLADLVLRPPRDHRRREFAQRRIAKDQRDS